MTSNSSTSNPRQQKHWYERIGPGLITACVVIGPGSILTSSRVGAKYGFSMTWVILLAVVFMMVFTSLGARLGVVAGKSPGTLIAERVGRWLAVLIGIGVFFISAAFQFGNNLGVRSAFEEFQGPLGWPSWTLDVLVVFFNVLAVVFLFGFRNLYKLVERLMMVLVAVMLVSFAINLVFAEPDWNEVLKGLLPPRSHTGEAGGSVLNLSLLGLVGTTFVVTAAYFQAFLVRQKGWTRDDLSEGLVDARLGVGILSLITIMIMATGASVLRGEQLDSMAAVAAGLRPTFGAFGHALFCLGLFSAAYSSFLVNSMIGGFILADGLGLGSRQDDFSTRVATVAVLMTGMTVALLVSRANFDPVPAIVAAQAVTVLASPLVAGALWWLTSRTDVMGEERNGRLTNVAALAGFVLLLGMGWYTATEKVLPVVLGWGDPS